MEQQDIESKSIEITNIIYKRYGSDCGVLFGLAFEQNAIVERIVKLTLEINEEEKVEK